MRTTAAFFLLALASACSTPTSNEPSRPARTSGGEAIELTLRYPDGTFLEVGELRGRVVLLFVFATYDAMSQMTLTPLRSVAERFPEAHIIGVAAQHSARLLVDAFENALSPPFPITYDPVGNVSEGGSALGEIEAVPTLIVLDRRGMEVARTTGFTDEVQIAEMLRAAGARERAGNEH